MSLANCKSCGRLYVQHKSEYCHDCQTMNDRYYFQMREFLKANPKSTVMDIHRKTGIPISKVLELQKSEYAPFCK